MDNKKSSRTNHMKYKYNVFKSDSTVQELSHKYSTYTFSITNLKDYLYEDMITRNSNVEKIKSYYRVKKWMIKNFPELMI